MKNLMIALGILSFVFALVGALRGTALATDKPQHDNGALRIGAPWGPANQDLTDPLRVVVTFEVKASKNIPPSAVVAVEDGIDAWEFAIDDREFGWDFDLVPFGNAGATASAARSPLFSHNPNAPPGHGGGGGGNGEDKPDIQIQLKKGGGLIAGQALSTLDGDGFRVGAKIKISGSFLGTASAAVTIKEITMHELGHALSLGHHSNPDDLMGGTVGDANGNPITSISGCDLDGFEEAHHWLTADKVTTPHLNHDTSITC